MPRDVEHRQQFICLALNAAVVHRRPNVLLALPQPARAPSSPPTLPAAPHEPKLPPQIFPVVSKVIRNRERERERWNRKKTQKNNHKNTEMNTFATMPSLFFFRSHAQSYIYKKNPKRERFSACCNRPGFPSLSEHVLFLCKSLHK